MVDTVCKADAEDLASEEPDVVNDKGRQTGLIDDIFPSVYGRGTGYFAPNNEDQSNIVDPAIDTIEEIVTKLCTIG